MVETPVRNRPSTGAGVLVCLAASVLGVAVSAYLTVEHYNTKLALVCPDTGAVNCAKVTTSRWSHLGPVPFAVLGLIFFVVMTGLCTPQAWRRRSLDGVRIAGAAAGVATVVYLVWAELFELDAICLWCTVVHACSLVLLGGVLWHSTSVRSAE
jgi:uncharacterized membrane protein